MMDSPGWRRARVVLAKPGLDGHDRGVKVVGMALRDAGAEVIYLGLHQSAEEVVGAAVSEDVDVIGLSVLSGVHIDAATRVINECRNVGLTDVGIVIGGTIPPVDVERLKALGVQGVFPVGTPLADVVSRVIEIATENGARHV